MSINKFKAYLKTLENLDTEKSFFKKYEKEDKLVILLKGVKRIYL